MDSVNLASEGNCNESTNRIKALGGVAERIGCTLNQVRFGKGKGLLNQPFSNLSSVVIEGCVKKLAS